MAGYPNLEPNHATRTNEDGDLVILCPFEVIDGHVTQFDRPLVESSIWSKDADPAEIECPVCEVFKGQLHYVGSPDCERTGEQDEQ